ncbi:hypothetical protein [Mucilaginibacter gossypii]|uniref:Uncharacterized protein n=1 Tax=Mucilaginibacter gossypii TaxID=551996 RepID=A0A1G8B9I3_9SPHI|nr:hypothetical protein [Mucilaginibacter gossypii]SDH29260.1 hypothetical protein SAMN05192573_108126 [Mucilaginibacter gossypii]
MNNTRGLLYPALHKFYSALSSLEKFEKGTNFFDNIAYLDNFFSEYRNITFVLQKSLAHTEFKSTYEDLRNQYLVNDVCKWFIDKRNEVLKQQPFDLEKRIVINIYSGQNAISLPELTFTIDNDVEYPTIIDSLRTLFMKISPLEVMFSAEFSFYESGQTEELYENFISGINHMKLFMAAMRKALNEDCKLSDELEKKIEDMNFYRVPKNMLFIDDYIFYCKKNHFEKASRVEMWAGPGEARSPLENLNKTYPNGDLFQKFELMHLVIFQMQKSLLPTCLVVYSNDTFEMLTYGGSIRTTMYRKFNELAKQIAAEGIVKVLFVTEMYIYDIKDFTTMDSRERIKHARNEILSFFMVEKDLTIRSSSYDTKRIDDFNYIASVMFQQPDKPTHPTFMNPVIQEFARLQAEISEKTEQ